MKTILIATNQINVTHGHGDYGTKTALATYSGYDEIKFPAFKNKEDYERFRKEKNIKSYLFPTLLEIEIYNPEAGVALPNLIKTNNKITKTISKSNDIVKPCKTKIGALTREVWLDYCSTILDDLDHNPPNNIKNQNS